MTSLNDDVTGKYSRDVRLHQKFKLSKSVKALLSSFQTLKAFYFPFARYKTIWMILSLPENLIMTQPSPSNFNRKPSQADATNIFRLITTSVQQVGIDKFKQRKKFMTESFCRCHDVRCCLQMTSGNVSREEWIRENGNIIKFYSP